MMVYFTYSINRIIVHCNFIYFEIGILLFLLLLIQQSDFLIGISMVFLVMANILNAFMLPIVVVSMLSNLKDLEQHLFALLIGMLNYPIAILFIHLLT